MASTFVKFLISVDNSLVIGHFLEDCLYSCGYRKTNIPQNVCWENLPSLVPFPMSFPVKSLYLIERGRGVLNETKRREAQSWIWGFDELAKTFLF